MLPSGSRNAAKWQTPESHVSPMNATPFASSAARAAATSATRNANPASLATNGSLSRCGSQKLSVTFGVSTSPSVPHSRSPKMSRYQAIARLVLRVGTDEVADRHRSRALTPGRSRNRRGEPRQPPRFAVARFPKRGGPRKAKERERVSLEGRRGGWQGNDEAAARALGEAARRCAHSRRAGSAKLRTSDARGPAGSPIPSSPTDGIAGSASCTSAGCPGADRRAGRSARPRRDRDTYIHVLMDETEVDYAELLGDPGQA